jgi:hypothetical protein
MISAHWAPPTLYRSSMPRTFSSLDSAEFILGYSGIYPVTDLATLPGDG